jgi:dihydroxy-acid dehydratase
LVENGDRITIDAKNSEIRLDISDLEMAKRKSSWTKPAPRYTRGLLAKYAKTVSSASTGAVTDRPD